MSALLKLDGYGIGSPPVTVVASRILCLSRIEYNGNPGTEITLDNGSTVRVRQYEFQVEEAYNKAINQEVKP